jgi:hypothetical protein
MCGYDLLFGVKERTSLDVLLLPLPIDLHLSHVLMIRLPSVFPFPLLISIKEAIK